MAAAAVGVATGVVVAMGVGELPGDAAAVYADPAYAAKVLGWKATLDLEAMCRDSWRWQQQNPKGYAS